MKRSRLDRRASAKEAVAKGSTGDSAVKGLLQQLGWAQVADLARTYSGADLVAVCACPQKHLLWAEVKAYPMGSIERESWDHIEARMEEVTERPRENFVLFTYQAPHGGQDRRRRWCVMGPFDIATKGEPRPFNIVSPQWAPPCGTPHPMGSKVDAPAPPVPEVKA